MGLPRLNYIISNSYMHSCYVPVNLRNSDSTLPRLVYTSAKYFPLLRVSTLPRVFVEVGSLKNVSLGFISTEHAPRLNGIKCNGKIKWYGNI